jgi:hypothetical protein
MLAVIEIVMTPLCVPLFIAVNAELSFVYEVEAVPSVADTDTWA